MNWNGVTGVIKIAQIVMVIPMHLCQSQLLLYQRNKCFPEATLILISRRRSRYNEPLSGAVPRSVDVPWSGLFPDLVIVILASFCIESLTKFSRENKGWLSALSSSVILSIYLKLSTHNNHVDKDMAYIFFLVRVQTLNFWQIFLTSVFWNYASTGKARDQYCVMT